MSTEPREVHREVLSCCGFKKCPEVSIFEDGSVELTDNDPAIGSVGTIKMRPETAARLAALVAEHAK
jgi:hypothetical protein